MLAEPDQTIVRWLDQMDPGSIWATAITVFEIRYGLAKRDPGLKTRTLEEAFANLIREDLAGRVAPFDGAAAEASSVLAAKRAASGRVVDFRDTRIAGIALSQKADVATRNIRHFANLVTRLVDPWADVVA
jgi:predicted nucleic acid-binding protein